MPPPSTRGAIARVGCAGRDMGYIGDAQRKVRAARQHHTRNKMRDEENAQVRQTRQFNNLRTMI
jgi:hypothetical protein